MTEKNCKLHFKYEIYKYNVRPKNNFNSYKIFYKNAWLIQINIKSDVKKIL